MTDRGPTSSAETDRIQRFFAQLAAGNPGALGLRDDCARLTPAPGEDLILTTDAVAAGVHFFPDDPPADIGWKALAVNLSDLAAKGARPVAYLMAVAFPERPDDRWMAEFARGLAEAQAAFGIALAGGDTDQRPGPSSITITAIGAVPTGTMVRRSGASPGDRLYVTGSIGDAALGLDLRQQPDKAKAWRLDAPAARDLIRRYLRPEPRLALAAPLRTHASAALDVSDGLAADLAHLARASGVAATVTAVDVPLSPAARTTLAAEPSLIERVLAGGDDYEILAAVPERQAAEFEAAARAAATPVTAIGRIEAGAEVAILDAAGRPIALRKRGWEHFS